MTAQEQDQSLPTAEPSFLVQKLMDAAHDFANCVSPDGELDEASFRDVGYNHGALFIEAARALKRQTSLLPLPAEPVARSEPSMREALIRLLRSFPTDTDLSEAGWDRPDIEEACNAYDFAKSAIGKPVSEGPKPNEQTEGALPHEAALREAMQVLDALNTGDWKLLRSLPAPYLTDEANGRFAWSVERQTAPFCDEAGNRLWHGSTAFGALQAARAALSQGAAK